MTNSSAAELTSHFFAYLTAAREVYSDISNRFDKNKVAIYNYDYSSFYAAIWGERGLAPKYDAASKSLLSQLAEANHRSPFGSVITSVSFWELLDSVRHHIEHAECVRHRTNIDDEFSKVRREIKEFEENVLSASDVHKITQIEAHRRLESLRNALGGQLTQQLRAAETLIGERGPLKGFGDMFPGVSLINIIPARAIQDVFQEMWRWRSPTDTRDYDDKTFRYWVDALNICACRSLTSHLNNNVSVNFVTKASHKSELCNDVGRSPYVPLFWFKGQQLPECGDARGLKRFFKWMKNDAKEIHDELHMRTDFPTYNGDRLLWEHMKAFMQTYLARLFSDTKPHDAIFEGFDQLRVAFKNPKSLQGTIDATLDEAHKTVQEILSRSRTILGDELINHPALEKNPTLLRTRRMFER